MLVKNLNEDYLKKDGLANKTIKNYLYQLRKIKELAGDLSILRDKAKIKRIILSNFSKYPNLYFNVLVIICKGYYGEEHKVSKYYTKLLQKFHYKPTNKLNNKEKELFISHEELVKILDNINYKEFQKEKQIRNYLLLCLYVYQPPRRNIYKDIINIFRKRNIDKLDPKFNYVYFPEQIFIFNDHKSKKTFGQQRIPINKKLMDVINFYNARTNRKNKYLLGNKTIENSNYSRLLKNTSNKYFEKKLTSQMYRKIYISYRQKDTLKNLEDIKKLGHSPNVSNSYYNKNIENEI